MDLRTLAVAAALALLSSTSALAQGRTMVELELDAQAASQFAAIPSYVEILPAGVRSGTSVWLGYADYGLGGDVCYEWFIVEPAQPIPDTAQYFVAVVVAQGGNRSYVWRGGVVPSSNCAGG